MFDHLQTLLWISLGAVLGANLRYWVAQGLSRLTPAGIPLGTLVINITGSFVLGFFLVWTTECACRPTLAAHRCHRVLRRLHDFFELRL
jgi:fluoride ion exporter CrcB/FEX